MFVSPDHRRIKWINKTVNREFIATGKFCLEGTSKASIQTCNMQNVSQNMLAYKYLIHFVYCSAFFPVEPSEFLQVAWFSRTGRNISVRIAARFFYICFYQLKNSEKNKRQCLCVCVYENIWATNKSHRAASSFRQAFYECGFRIFCNCRFDSKYYEFNEVFLCVQIFPLLPFFLLSLNVSFSLRSRNPFSLVLLTLAQCSIPKLMWNSFLIKLTK